MELKEGRKIKLSEIKVERDFEVVVRVVEGGSGVASITAVYLKVNEAAVAGEITLYNTYKMIEMEFLRGAERAFAEAVEEANRVSFEVNEALRTAILTAERLGLNEITVVTVR